MKFTLITKTGQIMLFYVKDMADMYQTLKGGVVITEQILQAQPAESYVDVEINQ